MSFRAGGQRGGGWVGGGGGASGSGNGAGGRGGGGGGWVNQGGGSNFGNDNRQGQGNRFSPLQHQQQGGGSGRPQPQETPEEAVRTDVQQEKPIWILSCYGHARGGANDLTGDVSFEEVRWINQQDIRTHRTPLSINADFKGAVKAKQEELNQLLARARDRRGLVPSLGGAPIRAQNTWLAQFLDPNQATAAPVQPPSGGFGAPLQPQPGSFGFGSQQPSQLPAQPPAAPGGSFVAAPGGFGQPSSAATGFGQPAMPAPALGGFGQPTGFIAPTPQSQLQPAPGGFGQPAAAGPFGQASGSFMGGGGFKATAAALGGGGAKASWAGQGGFGAAKPAPTQAPTILFGQNVSGTISSAGTGGAFVPMPPPGQVQQAPGAFQFPGFPPAAVPQSFGSPAAIDPAIAPVAAHAVPPPFGQPAVAAAVAAPTGLGASAAGPPAAAGAAGPSVAFGGTSGEEELRAFQSGTFTLGKIPETAPPPELCY